MEKKQFLDILSKYIEGKASAEEQQFLYSYYQLFMAEPSVTALLNDNEKIKLKLAIKANIDQRLNKTITPARKPVKLWTRITAAAAILLITGLVIYLLTNKDKPQISSIDSYANDIAPGKKGATLTLANGSQIYVADKTDGRIAEDHGVTITKSGDGELSYQRLPGKDDGKIAYNTLSTAKGETFKVLLPDQSVVYLNAASTLRYPTTFKSRTREVTLSGEAYFEVAKNPDMPFHVVTGRQTTVVLGTHFNLNSYPEETFLSTTLLEGKVKVTIDDQQVILRPGQQSLSSNQQIKGAAPEITVGRVNTEDVIAWKNGWFSFQDADIKTIMNQLSRWYDIEVVYQDKIPEGHYRGKVSRNVKISRVLKVLEASGINFKIEGKTIIVK
ncbi:FecR protein [Pedobacter steynii]|uniref:FecR protein n=1 Tax=Pedobacter steynii TaxID=430522 RepID=A0A1G9NIF8_9SPHI|nr:FecR family protein [Pedobacter steynii]NQX39305.1 FecR family protein [Pedobacter steynii]SDL85735.1 FecR protein [Pedobacter steynii]